jgi:hypothetical protein
MLGSSSLEVFSWLSVSVSSAKPSHPGKAKKGVLCTASRVSDRGEACQGLHYNVLAGSIARIHVRHGVSRISTTMFVLF